MLLNITDSAAFAGVARSTIYTNIANGKLSRTSEGLIDTAELLRVFGEPDKRNKTRKKTQLDRVNTTQDTTRHATQDNLEVEFLKEKVRFLESNLAEAKTREEWLKGQVDKLTEAVKLLEAPKPEKKGLFSRIIS